MVCILLSVLLSLTPSADEPKKDEGKPSAPPSIEEKTKGLRKIDGYVPLYWDDRAGKLFVEISRFDREFLYQEALASGLGSNPVGLDRGQLGDTLVVEFRRVGPKVLLVEPNTKFRALTDREAERRAVRESFAESVHAGFAVEAEEDGRVLVDATAFFLRDAHGVSERLKKSKQGAYKLDRSRSALDLTRTKGFPKNTEVEAILTFANDGEPGPLVSQTSANAQVVTVRARHSLVELPPLGGDFKPRRADPRVGVFTVDFYDFATPFDRPVETRWACRHRLVKKNPKEDASDAVEPIVYYVDPAAPEPVRKALIEGARWWSAAFTAAGFNDGYKVEVLPDDADPMDLRYNVIQWVHRSTRGWSYGTSVIDPRTGEILKGRVTLDSLRARQDALLGSGLVAGSGRDGCAAAAGPGPEHLGALDPNADVNELVLARIRQLSAHEVGHTLGLAHNFAASTYDRGSVMDYPAPLVKIKAGVLDLSQAYTDHIGSYDIFAICYAYSQFPSAENEDKGLARLVLDAQSRGYLFLSDADARPAGAAHPLANLWDNGDDPVAGLRHEMEVRRIGLDHFGLNRLENGAALSDLGAKLLPIYLHHRYQLAAAVKSLGGLDYTYAVKDAGWPRPSRVAPVVAADRQRDALAAVLDTLKPEVLVIPERILALIPPEAFASGGGTAEPFAGKTGPAFDPLAAATAAADLAVRALLQPQRAARLEGQHARDPECPGFADVVAALIDRAAQSPGDAREKAVARAVRSLVVTRLIELAANPEAADGVRAVAEDSLWRAAMAEHDSPDGRALLSRVKRFLDRPEAAQPRPTPAPAPPGDPIGAGRD